MTLFYVTKISLAPDWSRQITWPWYWLVIGSGWRDQTDGWAEQGEAAGDQPPGEGGESAAGNDTGFWLADTDTDLWLADTDLWLVTAADNRKEEEEGDSQRHQDWHPVQLRQEARRAGKSDKHVYVMPTYANL